MNKDKKKRLYCENLLICTVERANLIFNSILLDRNNRKRSNKPSYKDELQIGCVILDELHVLGNNFNGYLLEIFIRCKLYCNLIYNHYLKTLSSFSKLRFFACSPLNSSSTSTAANPQRGHIQIVGLSATMGNVRQLSDWLAAELYLSDFRPVPLLEHVVAGNQIIQLSKDGKLIEEKPFPLVKSSTSIHGLDKSSFVDSDHVVELTSKALQKGWTFSCNLILRVS